MEFNLRLLWCCITTLCYWLEKLAPLSQPIRKKTKPERDLLASVTCAHAFSRAWRHSMYLRQVLIGSLRCLCLLTCDLPEKLTFHVFQRAMARSRGQDGQKYKKCMEMFAPTSFWYFCSYAPKWIRESSIT